MALLELSTAIACPMQCSYCPQDVIGKVYTGPRLMELDTFARCLANCPADIPLSFAGYAEPYLNRRTSQMVAHAVAQGHRIQMYTTGAGMSLADVEALLAAQPYNVVLHLPDGDGDMKLPVTAAYLNAVTALDKGYPGLKAVCYGSMHPLLTERFGDRLAGYRLQTRAGNVGKTVRLRQHGPLHCRPDPFLENNVLIPTGELIACCQDYGLQHVLGNLLTETWDAIHSGPQITDMRRLMASENGDCLCRTCEYSCAS